MIATEIEKIELQNFKYREEIARMQKSLRKKNKAIKELNGAVKKVKLEWEAEVRENQRLRGVTWDMSKEIGELKSQLEKQQKQPEIPEVPQFVADWLEGDDLEDLIDVWYKHTSQLPEKVQYYLNSLGEDATTSEAFYKETVHLIARAKIDGYTVAKEKRFYLKLYRELESRGDTCIGYVTLYLKNGGYLTTDKTRAGKFTQQDIDSLETGSYEQIEVKE